jgi:hypothetical protein
LPDAFVNKPLMLVDRARNVGSVTWTPTGTLPNGLSLAVRVLSGTPTAAAGFASINFNLAADGFTVSKSVSLTVPPSRSPRRACCRTRR